MEAPATQLTFYIPSTLEASAPRAAAPHACLETLIARGDTKRISCRDDAQLRALFGGDPAGGSARAAVSHHAQYGSDAIEQWRIIASPVHLLADHATLHFPPQPDSLLNDGESRALQASCQEHFAEEGWQLEYGDANMWYLRVTGSTRITTTPLADAVGKPLFEGLPQGEDARVWRRWMNEAQMLFHTHAVNSARHARGQAPINSLWFWGEGRLPALRAKRFDHVYGGDRYVQGLAHLSGAQWSPLPEGLSAVNDALQHGTALIVLDEANRSRWDRAWFCPLAKQLRPSAIDSVALHFRDGHASQLTPAMRWRLWRRKHLAIAVTESAP